MAKDLVPVSAIQYQLLPPLRTLIGQLRNPLSWLFNILLGR